MPYDQMWCYTLGHIPGTDGEVDAWCPAIFTAYSEPGQWEWHDNMYVCEAGSVEGPCKCVGQLWYDWANESTFASAPSYCTYHMLEMIAQGFFTANPAPGLVITGYDEEHARYVAGCVKDLHQTCC